MKPLFNLKSFTMVSSAFFTNLASASCGLILIIPDTIPETGIRTHLISQTILGILFISLAVWTYSYEPRNILHDS